MSDVKTFKDFDNFFYYGKGDLETETKSDILATLMQPKKSLFYDRNLDSAGIQDYENFPISTYLNIVIPFEIVNSLSKRNLFVSNGEDGPDRRIAVSQSLVKLKLESEKVGITIQYIPLSNFKQSETVDLSLGV